MALFRRKPANPEAVAAREAFRRVAAELDAAQRTLLSAVPTARDSGTPLATALDGFLAGLDRAATTMPGWRTPRTEVLWIRCSAALERSHVEAERMRSDPTTDSLGFEALNARLGDLVSPLEEFADVASDIRRV